MKPRTMAIALAAMLCATFAAVIPAWAGAPTQAEKYWTWNTISVGQLKALTEQGLPDDQLINQRFRLIGTVRIVDMPVLSLGSYYFIQGEDNSIIAVKCSGEKPMQADEEFLTATLQKDPNDGWYLQEAHAWIFRSPGDIKAMGLDEPSFEDYRTWKNNAGYDYAVENAYRQFFIQAENGRRLQIIQVGKWNPPENQRTTVDEIQHFLDSNKPNAQSAGPTTLVVSTVPSGGATSVVPQQPVSQPVPPTQPPQLPKIGGDIPVWAWVIGGLVVFLLVVLLLLVFAVLLRRPAPAPIPAPAPVQPAPTQAYPTKETVVLVDGKSLEETLVSAPETVVLSPYSLRVVKGGPKSIGKILQLPGGECVMGRVGGTAQNFIQLDMSDRPDKERNCSRDYVKLTPNESEDVLYVEVMNTKGNPVTVDGKTIKARGDTLTARIGSHISLMPDWEFEVVPRS